MREIATQDAELLTSTSMYNMVYKVVLNLEARYRLMYDEPMEIQSSDAIVAALQRAGHPPPLTEEEEKLCRI